MACIVLSAAAAAALYHLKPQPLPWHPVGAERIRTPAFDIADSATRDVAKALESGSFNHHRGRWLGAQCGSDTPSNVEVYVLSRDGFGIGTAPWIAQRVIVELSHGGVATHEQLAWDDGSPIALTNRVLSDSEADDFRTLLLEGGFTRLSPSDEPWRCHREVVTLESCIRGRYYGVVRSDCRRDVVGPDLTTLADSIVEFVLDASDDIGSQGG